MPGQVVSHSPDQQRQAGIASIEFALIAAVMALMLLGIFMYWRALQAQQSVTRAAGDGARVVQNLLYGTLPGYDIRQPAGSSNLRQAANDVVKKSLQDSGIPGDPQTDATVIVSTNNVQAQLTVTYQLPPLFAVNAGATSAAHAGNWSLTEPTALRASALVAYVLAPGNPP